MATVVATPVCNPVLDRCNEEDLNEAPSYDDVDAVSFLPEKLAERGALPYRKSWLLPHFDRLGCGATHRDTVEIRFLMQGGEALKGPARTDLVTSQGCDAYAVAQQLVQCVKK